MIGQAFQILKREYRLALPEHNPPKQSITMREDEHGVCAYTNFMGARLSTGEVAVKAICVDEDENLTRSRTIVFDQTGAIIRNIDSVFLTNLRCGMMAALAAEKFFGEISPDTVVGLIGTGPMNVITAHVFRRLFGVTDFVVKGSPRNPAKNIELFPLDTRPVVSATGLDELKLCDVVISATSVPDTSESLAYDQLPQPALYIAQDGGWMLGESFRRELPGFSDNPAQLVSHARDEFPEYPKHKWAIEHFEDLRSDRFMSGRVRQAVVYLYGIALADAVVAVHLDHLTFDDLVGEAP